MRYAFRPIVIAVFVLLGSYLATSQIRSLEDPPYILSINHLQKAGYHLPESMPSLGQLMTYQDRASTHQELKVHWQLFTGEKKAVLKENAKALKLGREFELRDRKQLRPGIPGKTNLSISDDMMVICAVTVSAEVRAIVVKGGWTAHAEDLRPGMQRAWDYVSSEANFFFALPDDPKIDSIVFLLPRQVGDYFELQKMGAIQLAPPSSN